MECRCGKCPPLAALPPGAVAQPCPIVVATMPQSDGCGGERDFTRRFAPTVDRIRNRINRITGIKAYDVFLVWMRWDGEERGEGTEKLVMQVELLPTPLVEDLSAIAYQAYSGGVLPTGSVRISQVSASLRADTLSGNLLPSTDYLAAADGCGKLRVGLTGKGVWTSYAGLTPIEAARLNAGLDTRPHAHTIDPRVEFFYEIVERAPNAQRQKFRLASVPFKRKGQFDWTLMLERISEDRTRAGASKIGVDPSEF